MVWEYQVIYTLNNSPRELQKWLNRMARDGWALVYINADTLYAVFQRPTTEARDNQIIDIDVGVD